MKFILDYIRIARLMRIIDLQNKSNPTSTTAWWSFKNIFSGQNKKINRAGLSHKALEIREEIKDIIEKLNNQQTKKNNMLITAINKIIGELSCYYSNLEPLPSSSPSIRRKSMPPSLNLFTFLTIHMTKAEIQVMVQGNMVPLKYCITNDTFKTALKSVTEDQTQMEKMLRVIDERIEIIELYTNIILFQKNDSRAHIEWYSNSNNNTAATFFIHMEHRMNNILSNITNNPPIKDVLDAIKKTKLDQTLSDEEIANILINEISGRLLKHSIDMPMVKVLHLFIAKGLSTGNDKPIIALILDDMLEVSSHKSQEGNGTQNRSEDSPLGSIQMIMMTLWAMCEIHSDYELISHDNSKYIELMASKAIPGANYYVKVLFNSISDQISVRDRGEAGEAGENILNNIEVIEIMLETVFGTKTNTLEEKDKEKIRKILSSFLHKIDSERSSLIFFINKIVTTSVKFDIELINNLNSIAISQGKEADPQRGMEKCVCDIITSIARHNGNEKDWNKENTANNVTNDIVISNLMTFFNNTSYPNMLKTGFIQFLILLILLHAWWNNSHIETNDDTTKCNTKAT